MFSCRKEQAVNSAKSIEDENYDYYFFLGELHNEVLEEMGNSINVDTSGYFTRRIFIYDYLVALYPDLASSVDLLSEMEHSDKCAGLLKLDELADEEYGNSLITLAEKAYFDNLQSIIDSCYYADDYEYLPQRMEDLALMAKDDTSISAHFTKRFVLTALIGKNSISFWMDALTNNSHNWNNLLINGDFSDEPFFDDYPSNNLNFPIALWLAMKDLGYFAKWSIDCPSSGDVKQCVEATWFNATLASASL